MGSTFVTLRTGPPNENLGFWMRDDMLELWLRLLALHLPEPTCSGEHQATYGIRNQWLLASKGYFLGCVPDGMEEACSTPEGRAVVRTAVDSLLAALKRRSTPLDPATLNLLGFDYAWGEPVDRWRLIDVGHAFIDLLEGRITGTAASTKVFPGLKPYEGSPGN